MNAKLPSTLISFLGFLDKKCVVALLSQQISDSFEDSIMTYKIDEFYMRLVQERSHWCIEFGSSEKSKEWYDTVLIKELITKKIEKDVLTLEEQIKHLKTNWPSMSIMFKKENDQELLNKLEHLRQERAKRRFPGWFK